MRNVRYAFRSLRKTPGFAAAAILTLALGIGANTAIFSVVEGVVLAPLPYSDPDRLVMIQEINLSLKRDMSISYPDSMDWRRDARSFERMAMVRLRGFDLTYPGSPEHVAAHEVTAGFFSTLGVTPIYGREFSAAEDRQHGAPVAIISHRLWTDRFGGSAEAIGKSITLEGAGYTVIGILPADFRFLEDADVYTPLGQGDPSFINDRTIHPGIGCVARLKSGVSMAQARAEMSAVQARLSQLYPGEDRGVGTEVVPLKQVVVGNVSRTLLMLLGAVGLVLLIACANVANLLLARSLVRAREFAIRSALGAGRGRIAWQLVTESLLLSLSGGALGLVAAKWALHPALAAVGGSLPSTANIGVSLPVLLFTFGVSIAVGIVFGLVPVLRSSNTDLQTALREGGYGSTGGHPRAQHALVMIQIAMTLVLLAGASLLFRTIRNLAQVNPGFNPKQVIMFKVGLSPAATGTPALARVAYRQLMDRIRAIPGIDAADITNLVPLNQESNAGPFWTGAQTPASIAEAPRANFYWTGPDYARAMQIPVVRGRYLRADDTLEAERVVVIDTVLARSYFGDRDPVGQTLTIAHWGTARIVGVVGHVRHWGLDDANLYTQNEIYCSFYQLSDQLVPLFLQDITVAVRTALDVTAAVPAMKSAVYNGVGDQPVYNIRTMQQTVSKSMAAQRFPMILLGAFAMLALLLGSVGIYGVVSYSMTQRTREVGIRMALGAMKGDVLRMVLGQGMRMAAAGIAIGTVAALILTRVLLSFASLLYGVRPWDPFTLIVVSVILLTAALAACYLPARRVANVDSVRVLRND